MSKLNKEESEKAIQKKQWKIIDWKNSPNISTCIGAVKYFGQNTIQTFPNMEEIGGDVYASENQARQICRQ